MRTLTCQVCSGPSASLRVCTVNGTVRWQWSGSQSVRKNGILGDRHQHLMGLFVLVSGREPAQQNMKFVNRRCWLISIFGSQALLLQVLYYLYWWYVLDYWVPSSVGTLGSPYSVVYQTTGTTNVGTQYPLPTTTE